MTIELRRREYELATGTRLRFLVPFAPIELALGALCLLLLGFVLGYLTALELATWESC